MTPDTDSICRLSICHPLSVTTPLRNSPYVSNHREGMDPQVVAMSRVTFVADWYIADWDTLCVDGSPFLSSHM